MSTTLEKPAAPDTSAQSLVGAAAQLSTDDLAEFDAPLSERETSRRARCEAVIEHGLKSFYEVGNALLTIRDEKLYRETHRTFEDYFAARFGMKRSSAYRWISAAEVVKNLLPEEAAVSEDDEMSPIGDISAPSAPRSLPLNEAQARPLAALPAEAQREVWESVTAGDDHPTAAKVQAGVEEWKKANAPAPAPLENPKALPIVDDTPLSSVDAPPVAALPVIPPASVAPINVEEAPKPTEAPPLAETAAETMARRALEIAQAEETHRQMFAPRIGTLVAGLDALPPLPEPWRAVIAPLAALILFCGSRVALIESIERRGLDLDVAPLCEDADIVPGDVKARHLMRLDPGTQASLAAEALARTEVENATVEMPDTAILSLMLSFLAADHEENVSSSVSLAEQTDTTDTSLESLAPGLEDDDGDESDTQCGTPTCRRIIAGAVVRELCDLEGAYKTNVRAQDGTLLEKSGRILCPACAPPIAPPVPEAIPYTEEAPACLQCGTHGHYVKIEGSSMEGYKYVTSLYCPQCADDGGWAEATRWPYPLRKWEQPYQPDQRVEVTRWINRKEVWVPGTMVVSNYNTFQVLVDGDDAPQWFNLPSVRPLLDAPDVVAPDTAPQITIDDTPQIAAAEEEPYEPEPDLCRTCKKEPADFFGLCAKCDGSFQEAA